MCTPQLVECVYTTEYTLRNRFARHAMRAQKHMGGEAIMQKPAHLTMGHLSSWDRKHGRDSHADVLPDGLHNVMTDTLGDKRASEGQHMGPQFPIFWIKDTRVAIKRAPLTMHAHVIM
eukprot:1144499-Pelagomonas_calceolata.AAC.3